MRCTGFEERVARYVGGDLTAHESATVEQHLRGCADCAELARELERDRAWLASRPAETANVDFAAMRREIRRKIARRPKSVWRWVAAAAAIILVLGLAATLRKTPPGRTARSEARATPSMTPPGVGRTSARTILTAPRETARPAVHKAQQLAAEEPGSSVEIRIATRDPHVTIILLHESRGVLP
jgi:anti-sigma factor RsiW